MSTSMKRWVEGLTGLQYPVGVMDNSIYAGYRFSGMHATVKGELADRNQRRWMSLAAQSSIQTKSGATFPINRAPDHRRNTQFFASPPFLLPRATSLEVAPVITKMIRTLLMTHLAFVTNLGAIPAGVAGSPRELVERTTEELRTAVIREQRNQKRPKSRHPPSR